MTCIIGKPQVWYTYTSGHEGHTPPSIAAKSPLPLTVPPILTFFLQCRTTSEGQKPQAMYEEVAEDIQNPEAIYEQVSETR